MTISISSLAWWTRKGKTKDQISKASAEYSFVEKKYTSQSHKKVSNDGKVKKVYEEYGDVVLVSYEDDRCSDDCWSDWCLFDCESDDLDWSIGWLEPLRSNFVSNDDGDDFAVLVPSYTARCKEVRVSNKGTLDVIKNLSKDCSSDYGEAGR
ncbi:unnamed protein product [Sphenostylis stenocarpa]|uniref:Uncharacterized protein n=1 Tax=Sphenostylis stenocarpa TaxID=92480 RepID=A0AA86S394_9FABA|nr:unnamed protein product [Sphenostylis stenocarpa]